MPSEREVMRGMAMMTNDDGHHCARSMMASRRRVSSEREVMRGMAMIAMMTRIMQMTQHIFLRTCQRA